MRSKIGTLCSAVCASMSPWRLVILVMVLAWSTTVSSTTVSSTTSSSPFTSSRQLGASAREVVEEVVEAWQDLLPSLLGCYGALAGTLHYTTLHYTTLHYTTLHYTSPLHTPGHSGFLPNRSVMAHPKHF